MKYYVLFLALACFLYGLWAVLTGKLLGKDGKDIAEKYRRRYARICGAVLLILSALFVIVPAAVLRAAKRVWRK